MGLGRMFKGFNAGGAKIDTVLDAPTVVPGGEVTGAVHINGGSIDLDVQGIRLDFEAEVEVQGQDGEYKTNMRFSGVDAVQPFKLAQGQQMQVPFRLPVPWEAPITEVYGRHLRGMKVGVRTKLQVAKAVDPGDLDAVAIAPLPSQQGILDAMGQLGFEFKSADLEKSRQGSSLPFHQEIEFKPAPQFRGKVKEVELTFVTDAHGMTVVLEVDRKGGLLRAGGDKTVRFTVPHAQAMSTDWRSTLQQHIDEKSRGWF